MQRWLPGRMAFRYWPAQHLRVAIGSNADSNGSRQSQCGSHLLWIHWYAVRRGAPLEAPALHERARVNAVEPELVEQRVHRFLRICIGAGQWKRPPPWRSGGFTVADDVGCGDPVEGLDDARLW